MIGRAIWLQLLTFSLVGVVNTAIQYGVFVVLLRVAHVHYLLASTLGYGCGLLNSYVMNSRWTFGQSGRSAGHGFARFSVVNLAALGLNTLTLYSAVNGLGLSPEAGQATAVVASMAMNFLGNKLWAFKPAVLTAQTR